jgi:Xaa-Pro aminopeptidase
MTVDLRDAATRHDELLRQRLDEVVPLAMERADLDVWVIIGREYAEGAVLRTMLPATWINARRRTVLVFRRDRATGAVERLAVARYDIEGLYPASWDPGLQPDQWSRVVELIGEGEPRRIGVDTSDVLAHADGLSAAEHAAFWSTLPHELRRRLVSADVAATVWLETRLPAEVQVMREACAIGHGFLARALSSEVIKPGVTTTRDVEWWLRQRVHDAYLGSWFHPTVRLQRNGPSSELFAAHPEDLVIERGDVVHIDFGVVSERLCTDQQQHAYVLRDGETEAPKGLTRAFAAGNRLQDLLLAEFRVGRTGNDLLRSTLEHARAEGIDAKVYSHPLGLHGHGAGPAIGMWDKQDGVPGTGDLVVDPNTCWSIELAASVRVEGWTEPVAIMLEEDVFFDGERVDWLDGRQTELYLID